LRADGTSVAACSPVEFTFCKGRRYLWHKELTKKAWKGFGPVLGLSIADFYDKILTTGSSMPPMNSRAR